jgi:hypothetical protein
MELRKATTALANASRNAANRLAEKLKANQ